MPGYMCIFLKCKLNFKYSCVRPVHTQYISSFTLYKDHMVRKWVYSEHRVAETSTLCNKMQFLVFVAGGTVHAVTPLL